MIIKCQLCVTEVFVFAPSAQRKNWGNFAVDTVGCEMQNILSKGKKAAADDAPRKMDIFVTIHTLL